MVLAGFAFFSWASICVRLFQIQILNGARYQATLIQQSQKKQNIPANRGNIYDQKNRPLTRNIIHYTLSVNPEKVTDKQGLSRAISERTGISHEKYLEKLNSKSKFEYLERNLQRETLGPLLTTSYQGLKIERKFRRYYPHNQIAAQILGYTNFDDEGISGIEKDFNNYLTGTSGWVAKTKGWSGQVQHKSGMPFNMPIDGNNIQLTLDLEYQSILEEELQKRRKETNALAATGIIMNPQTGEVLAIASVPGFNNNNFRKSASKFHRIRSITDWFEPGSTFKIVAATSAAFDEDISLKEEFNCENGEFQYYSIQIKDHDPHGMLTVPQIINHSSNIGIVKLSEKLGRKTIYDTSINFGFGSKTGISLNGEVPGKLIPTTNYSAVSLGHIAMGHQVGVTAIQLAAAYCAIANGGYLIKPRLIRQIINDKNEVVYSETTTIIRKIANEQAMRDVRKMLRGVVTNGTGTNANIPGWDIAGKTGTAQKVKNGKYSNELFISNFIGFFPYKDPQLLAFIMLDEPEKPFHWGNEGAAVAFQRIVSRIINMDDSITPPQRSKKQNKYVNNDQKEDIIIGVREIEKLPESTLPINLSTISSRYSNKVKMPELRGLSMRKAMAVLNEHDLKFKMDGSGTVSWQAPKPGDFVSKGLTCDVGLK